MNYQIKKIHDKDEWNSFVKKQSYVNILSSWQWQEFERDCGESIHSYGVYADSSLEGVFSYQFCKSKKGKFLLLRHTIFLDWENPELFSKVISFLEKECRNLGASFFRIRPTLLFSHENKELFEEIGFKKSIIQHLDAQYTRILKLDDTLDDIWMNMRKNTRNLVRKAEKLDIEIIRTQGDEFLDDFEKIYNETVSRHGWNAFDFEHVKKQYKFLTSNDLSDMFVARYEGKIVSVAIFSKFSEQVIYHHSGSVSLKDVPVNYLLIWEAIKYYRDIGVKEFNFFGVVGKDETRHPWYGLSLFKRGFGGSDRELIGDYDYHINPKYFFSRFLEIVTVYLRIR